MLLHLEAQRGPVCGIQPQRLVEEHIGARPVVEERLPHVADPQRHCCASAVDASSKTLCLRKSKDEAERALRVLLTGSFSSTSYPDFWRANLTLDHTTQTSP